MKKIFIILLILAMPLLAIGIECDDNADGKMDADCLNVDTDLTSVSGSDDTLPSAKATKTALDLKSNIATPTFTTSIAIGAVTVSETEFGILENATPSTTEINYVDGVTSSIQTQITNRYKSGDTGAVLTLDSLDLTENASSPTEVVREMYLTDGTYDPASVGGSNAYWYIYDGANYVAVLDEDGTLFASSIEMPSYTHFATADAAYSDTTTPHVLISAEMKGGMITNCGAAEDRVYTLKPAAFGMNFIVMTCVTAVSRQMDIEPDSGEALWLNGLEMAADEHIENAADTKGQVMSCWSAETGDGTYEIFCKSDNSNWAQASPP